VTFYYRPDPILDLDSTVDEFTPVLNLQPPLANLGGQACAFCKSRRSATRSPAYANRSDPTPRPGGKVRHSRRESHFSAIPIDPFSAIAGPERIIFTA